MLVRWRVTDAVAPIRLVDTITDAVPPVGSPVLLPDSSVAYVRNVTWSPWGRGEDFEPFASVVLSLAPPR